MPFIGKEGATAVGTNENSSNESRQSTSALLMAQHRLRKYVLMRLHNVYGGAPLKDVLMRVSPSIKEEKDEDRAGAVEEEEVMFTLEALHALLQLPYNSNNSSNSSSTNSDKSSHESQSSLSRRPRGAVGGGGGVLERLVRDAGVCDPAPLRHSQLLVFLETGRVPEPSPPRPGRLTDNYNDSGGGRNGENVPNSTATASYRDDAQIIADATSLPHRTAPADVTAASSAQDRIVPISDHWGGGEERMNAAYAADEPAAEDGGYTVSFVEESSSSSAPVLAVAVVAGSSSGGGDMLKRPFWRKQETTTQERVTLYSTVDAGGAVQELEERETTRTQVVHMEVKATGEFAHREVTTFEQSELFNKESVVDARGFEEYVHLKSLSDEFEYMDSDGVIPGRGAPAAGEADDEGGAEAAAGGEGRETEAEAEAEEGGGGGEQSSSSPRNHIPDPREHGSRSPLGGSGRFRGGGGGGGGGVSPLSPRAEQFYSSGGFQAYDQQQHQQHQQHPSSRPSYHKRGGRDMYDPHSDGDEQEAQSPGRRGGDNDEDADEDILLHHIHVFPPTGLAPPAAVGLFVDVSEPGGSLRPDPAISPSAHEEVTELELERLAQLDVDEGVGEEGDLEGSDASLLMPESTPLRRYRSERELD